MRYVTPGAFRTALERRLRDAARQTDVPLVRLRKLVVFERLLARLLLVAPDRWLLKGALALDLRLGARSRTTRDTYCLFQLLCDRRAYSTSGMCADLTAPIIPRSIPKASSTPRRSAYIGTLFTWKRGRSADRANPCRGSRCWG